MGGINFGDLSAQSPADTATEPRRIFAALRKADAAYNYPRDVQSQVWESWHANRDSPDVLIKMNTGGGKTVVGLTILKSCLNEHVSPVVYLTPSKLLTAQVCDEAAAIGIEATTDIDDIRFRSGRAILVANIYKFFNGRSVFGVAGGHRQPADIGAVLIDDAHACLDILQQQYTITLKRTDEPAQRLFALFQDDLRTQSSARALEVEHGDPTAAMMIPWWAWQREMESLTGILFEHREHDRIKFVWPLIRELLPICTAGISGTELMISPPLPALDAIPSFRNAARRIYLSATLTDDSVLVTHFGARRDTITGPITPSTAGDLGDRLILTPQETHPDLDDEGLAAFLLELAADVNVVVITPSYRSADRWRDRTTHVFDGETIDEGVSALRSGRHLGLVVLVGRYDGIDLPGDACRVLVLDGLPEANTPLERMESLALHGSAAQLQRQIRRIEQGMGRGVRSSDDHCVVLLAGRRLTERLYLTEATSYFSPATRAQVELSRRVADLLHGDDFEKTRAAIAQVLDRDPEWIAANSQALDEIQYESDLAISDMATTFKSAFDAASVGRYQPAAEELYGATESLNDLRYRGWVRQQAASYMGLVDPVRAQGMQAAAQSDNRAVLKPSTGVPYQRLPKNLDQARRMADYLSDRYPDTSQMVIGTRALLSELVPRPEQTDVESFEEALHQLAAHIGLVGQRPERDIGNGPDVLWLLGQHKYLVIECKSGSTADLIPRRDIEQLSHSMDWFVETYDPDCRATPVLIHPAHTLHRQAVPRAGTRIITFERLGQLRQAIDALFVAISSHGSVDAGSVSQQLSHHDLAAAELINLWGREPRRAAR